MSNSWPTSPWIPIVLLAGGIATAAIWRSSPVPDDDRRPDSSSLAVDTAAATPIIAREVNADPFIGNFYFLFDVSASANQAGSRNDLRQSVPIFRGGFTAMRQMEELLPARFRVGTIGDLSLHQRTLCDLPVEPPTLFRRTDTLRLSKAVGECERLLLESKPEPYTDIRGALGHASMSIRGLSPGVRGIILISDLEESLAPHQVPANPDLSGICVVIYSQVTRAAAIDPAKLDTLQSVWRKYLKERQARKISMVSSLGFDGADLVSFFRDCESK